MLYAANTANSQRDRTYIPVINLFRKTLIECKTLTENVPSRKIWWSVVGRTYQTRERNYLIIPA